MCVREFRSSLLTTQFTRIALAPRRNIRPRPSVARAQPPMANMFNKLKSLINDAAAPSTAAAAASTPAARAPMFFADDAPSWEELEALVEQQERALGVAPVDLESGPATPSALRRTFGQPGEPRVKLYRDHAAWCPYCHKVVLQLEEKRIPYVIEKINMRCYGDKPPEFMAKVPSGLLPVLEVDGQIITESAVIQGLLEQMYPEPALLPPEGSEARARAAALFRLERRLFGDWLQWLCNGWGNDGNRAAFEATMDAVERELGVANGPYFLEDFSLVDIVFAPFLERIAASIAFYKGMIVRGAGRFPNLERWFEAMETRQPYLAFRSDYYTHCWDLPPQLGGCVSTPEGTEVAAVINGGGWHLPLAPLTATSLPEPYSPGRTPRGTGFRRRHGWCGIAWL